MDDRAKDADVAMLPLGEDYADIRAGVRVGVTVQNLKRGIIRKRRHPLSFNRADNGRGRMLLV